MTAFRTLDYLKYRGEWDTTIVYVTNDTVTVGSVAYIALQENQNSLPPSSDWIILAQGTPGTPGAAGSQGVQGTQGTQGPQGFQGIQGSQGGTGGAGTQGSQGNQGTQGTAGANGGVNWRGTWNSGTTYAQGDGVTFSGQAYLALTSTTNNQPNTSPTQWQVFTGSTGPQGPQGFQGTQGFQGSSGSAGPQGNVGATGSQGAQGATGSPVPIGTVIDWWRPSSAVSVPAGFVIPTGQTLTSGQHSFPGVAGSVILPDLRNKMILGADIAKADGTSATSATDGAPGAPGVNGSGGSNFRDLTHSHSVDMATFTSGSGGNISQNTGSAGADTVSTSNAGAATVTSGNNSTSQNVAGGGGPINVAGSPHTHNVSVPSHTHNVSVTNHTHPMNVASHTHSINPPSANSSGGLGVFDIHPQYVGMLRLMRVQ